MLDKIFTKTQGLKNLSRQLKEKPEKVLHALEKSMYQEMEGIITQAKELTPVDTGALRSSGFVRLPERAGSTVNVVAGFGGPAGSGNVGETNRKDVGYAVRVHEDTVVFHPVGMAKYLEIPYKKALAGMVERIRNDVAKDV